MKENSAAQAATNNTVQPALTDDEIEALARKHIAPHADRLDAILPTRVPYQQTEQFRRVKALIEDLLSKLRAPVAEQKPIKLSDDVLQFLKDGVADATQCEESDVDQAFADQLLLLMHTPLYTEPPPKQRAVDWGPLVVAPVADERQPVGYIHPDTLAQLAFPMTPYREVPLYRVHRPHPEFDAKRPAGLVPIYTAPPAALASAPVAEVKDWRIDTSAGRPILVYKNCSVIEAEDAEYVLRLIAADRASAPVAGEAQRQQRVAYTDSCGHLHWTNGRRILVSLYAAPQASTVAGEAQPFMYGIMGPDGKAHFEEFCVSGDRDELQAEVVDHLNRENPEDGPYSVVALFRDSTPQASAEPVRILFPAHLRKMWSGGEVQAWLDQHQGVTPPPATTKGSLARYRQWKAEQEQATASCTCPSGDGSLRHPCAAHPAKASGNGGEKWSDS